MLINHYQEFIIWGLPNRRHSHRFIHKGFYENLKRMHPDVYWLPDSRKAELSPFKRRLIIASGMASRHLPILPNTDYVLHNVELSDRQRFSTEVLNSKILHLQVYTKTASGDSDKNSPYISLDLKNRTLFQPWGTPTPRHEWRSLTNKNLTNIEYWIGAVWNNKQNQGNSETIETYKKVLDKYSIEFRRIGGSRFRKDGISEAKAADIVRESRLGAAIVGEWQRQSKYVPCRIFKNIAAGVPPISNGDYTDLFGSAQLFSPDIELLVQEAISESTPSKQTRLEEAQHATRAHTYEANIIRIVEALVQL